MHQRCHPLGELTQIAVELLDVVGAHPQHRVRVLANLGERDPAPRLERRFQLFVANLLGFGHLGECNQTSWGSTSTTTVKSAFRIAGAAADRSWLARDASSRGRAVFATSWAR